MKLSGWRCLLLAFCFLTSCSKKLDYAASAVVQDFAGQWSGTWDWDTNSIASLDISGTHIKVSRFPMRSDPSGEVAVVWSEGEIEFNKEWAIRAPCILVLLTNNELAGVPLYITQDKEHLIYDVSVVREQRVMFNKVGPSAKPDSNERKLTQ